MLLKHVHKLKPAEIAKKLRVSVEDVYRAESRLKVKHAFPFAEVVVAMVNICNPPDDAPRLAVFTDPPAVAVRALSAEYVVPFLNNTKEVGAVPKNCQRASAILEYEPATTSNAAAEVARNARPVKTLIMLYVALHCPQF